MILYDLCIEEMTFLGLEEDIAKFKKQLDEFTNDIKSGNFFILPGFYSTRLSLKSWTNYTGAGHY